MKSNKQRRAEIMARREKRKALLAKAKAIEPPAYAFMSGDAEPVDRLLFGPNNSYGWPDFAKRGYYLPRAFTCKNCGVEEVWTASQQKWWYEIARGDLFSVAVRCRPCRAQERERKAAARAAAIAGWMNKLRVMAT
jgi:Probable zinc-ribbon domain